ncbi:hypothetical protein D3C85_15120 [compost metagenome]
MIQTLFDEAFDEIEGFTHDLEKEKSSNAINEMQSIWRIVKSIQLRYRPDLDPDRLSRLDRLIGQMGIGHVAETSFTEKEARTTLNRFKDTCGFRHENISE